MFQRVAWVVIAILIAWIVANTFASIFACWPIQAQWKVLSHSQCVDIRALYTSGVISNTIIDGQSELKLQQNMLSLTPLVIVIVVPIYNVWQLQMPLRRKIGVCLIFALGGFVIIAGIVRMVYLIETYSILKTPIWYDYSCKSRHPFYKFRTHIFRRLHLTCNTMDNSRTQSGGSLRLFTSDASYMERTWNGSSNEDSVVEDRSFFIQLYSETVTTIFHKEAKQPVQQRSFREKRCFAQGDEAALRSRHHLILD
jgi:hypothetical protein